MKAKNRKKLIKIHEIFSHDVISSCMISEVFGSSNKTIRRSIRNRGINYIDIDGCYQISFDDAVFVISAMLNETSRKVRLFIKNNEKKRCNTCFKYKKPNKFYKKLDGLQPSCKKCQLIERKNYAQTKEGLASVMYISQVKRRRKKGKSLPEYSKDEFINWLLSSVEYNKLFDEWQRSNYDLALTPSVDRIDDDGGYSFDNVQIMTWQENQEKAHESFRLGKLQHWKKHIPVYQYSIDGEYLSSFPSINAAKRSTGIDTKSIRLCMEGKYKQAGGFIWKSSKE